MKVITGTMVVYLLKFRIEKVSTTRKWTVLLCSNQEIHPEVSMREGIFDESQVRIP